MKNLHVSLIVLNITVIFILFLIEIIQPTFFAWISDSLNDIIISICISILTSTFFYYLLVYIPNKRKKRIVNSMISQHLIRIANNMIVIIAYLADISSIESKSIYYDDISPKSFDKMIRGVNPKEKKAYLRTLLSRESYYIENISLETINDERYSFITKEINAIFSNPTIIYEDEILIKILSDIKNSGFFYVLKADLSITNRELKALFEASELYLSYISLLKYVKPSPIHLKKANEEEIIKYSI